MRTPRRSGQAAACVMAALILAGCGNKNTTPVDDIAPGRVADLRVTAVTDSTVVLSWTAPGGDGSLGQASRYEFRYSDSRLSDQDWESGIVISPVPEVLPSGTAQQLVVRDLPSLRLSWFALRTEDQASNWSVMSNQVSATPGPPACVITPDSLAFGQVEVGSGFTMSFLVSNGGGGTLSDQVGEGCPPEFQVVAGGDPFALLAGEQATVKVRFTPASEGPKTCAVGLRGPCRAVPCTGAGVTAGVSFVPVDVGAGTAFTMGSPEGERGRDPDEVQHQVTLTRSFQVCNHEVTQAEWVQVMNWNDSSFPGADQPVDNLTWFDAVAYCIDRSTAEGLTPAYSMGVVTRDPNDPDHIVSAQVVWHPENDGYRLLTEAEWEYVCRAGTQTAFYTGDLEHANCDTLDTHLDPAAWFCSNSASAAHPVRGKIPNAWGLYDTHGNLYEWCWDWYADYGGDGTDPIGPDAGRSRIVRGGSYFVAPVNCRSAYRFYHEPGNRFPEVGLRIARAAQ